MRAEHFRPAEEVSLKVYEAQIPCFDEVRPCFDFFRQHAVSPRTETLHHVDTLLLRREFHLNFDNVRHLPELLPTVIRDVVIECDCVTRLLQAVTRRQDIAIRGH